MSSNGKITLDANGRRILSTSGKLELAGDDGCTCCIMADCLTYSGMELTYNLASGGANLNMGTKANPAIVGPCEINNMGGVGVGAPVAVSMPFNAVFPFIFWSGSTALANGTYVAFLNCLRADQQYDFGATAAAAIGCPQIIVGPVYILELQAHPNTGDETVNFYAKYKGASPVGTYTAIGACSNLATIDVTA